MSTNNTTDDKTLQSLLFLLNTYKQQATKLLAQRISVLTEIAKQLVTFKTQHSSADKDVLVELYTQIVNEYSRYKNLALTQTITTEDLIYLSLWKDMCINLKTLIENEYWQNNKNEYIHISVKAYHASAMFLYWNKVFQQDTPLDLINNHNERSVRITYELNSLFPHGEVLMAKDPHGVDAIVCYKNDKQQITDNHGVVIPFNSLNDYIHESIKKPNRFNFF